MAIRGVLRHESITVSTTAVGMTVTQAAGGHPDAAIVTVEDAAIRFTIDCTTATTTVGHIAEHGDVIELVGRDELARFSAISKNGGTATLKVTQGNEHAA